MSSCRRMSASRCSRSAMSAANTDACGTSQPFQRSARCGAGETPLARSKHVERPIRHRDVRRRAARDALRPTWQREYWGTRMVTRPNINSP
jgi:hypothetical protein